MKKILLATLVAAALTGCNEEILIDLKTTTKENKKLTESIVAETKKENELLKKQIQSLTKILATAQETQSNSLKSWLNTELTRIDTYIKNDLVSNILANRLTVSNLSEIASKDDLKEIITAVNDKQVLTQDDLNNLPSVDKINEIINAVIIKMDEADKPLTQEQVSNLIKNGLETFHKNQKDKEEAKAQKDKEEKTAQKDKEEANPNSIQTKTPEETVELQKNNEANNAKVLDASDDDASNDASNDASDDASNDASNDASDDASDSN
ncbi:MAG: lipoprotein [Mesoflavibacter sp.]|nr:lipoprotein [Mesoflavibacter sp.]